MIYGIVLAAGQGRRIGTPKALLALNGQTFHQRALRAFTEAGLDTVTVISPQILDLLPVAPPRERRLVNPDPDQPSGMFASVRLGVLEAIRLGASGAILLPVDHPLVTEEDVLRVAESLERGAPIAIAAHGGRRGHPIGVGLEVMNEVVGDSSLRTLRDVVHKDPSRVVEVAASQGAVLGVNTKEDLDRVSNGTFR